ncbi:MAG: hypothetical protein KAJ19_05215 [Gammaproteobacteria bacterium]|nr:hypothetical protein [Gammaproteobacteria bacterium]
MSEEYSTAWLVDVCDGLLIAVAECEMMAFETPPSIRTVPLAAPLCSQVVFWGDRIVPLVMLGTMRGEPTDSTISAVVILAYQSEPKVPLRYVALAVKSDPVKIMVSDKQTCDFPDNLAEDDIWGPLSLSVFSRNGQPVPILNVALLCSRVYHDSLENA